MATQFQNQYIQVPVSVVKTNVKMNTIECEYEDRLVTNVDELKQAYTDIKNFTMQYPGKKFANATKTLDKFGGEVKVANTERPDVKEMKINKPHPAPKAMSGPDYKPR